MLFKSRLYIWVLGQSGVLLAQQPNYTLQTNESGTTKAYVARDSVSMKPGFTYTATSSTNFNAKIDAGLLFPPADNYLHSDGMTVNNDAGTDGAVVGSIPGQFAVSPTGAATYTIPIECPAGINGMQPNITVGYSSQAGYGVLGTGWNLTGISAITRGGKTIYFDVTTLPPSECTNGVQLDKTDPLYIDGLRLIKLSGNNFEEGAEYATEIEDYSRVKILKNSSGDIYFQLTTQDGKILEYGRTDDSKIADGINTLSWRLNKTIDPYGNAIIYTYSVSEETNENILSKIEYGGQTMLFDYNENNTYAHEVYIKGFKYTQSKLLHSITTKIGSTIIKKYEFVYNNLDKLEEVKLSDGNNIAINSSKINWGSTNNEPQFNELGNVANTNLDNYDKGTSSVDFVDINGDGYKDRVERWIGNSSNSGFINVYFYNNSTKTYSNSVSVSTSLPYYDYDKYHQQFLFVDINNDGKEDIIYTNNNNLYALTYKNGSLQSSFYDGRSSFSTKSYISVDKDDIVKLTISDVNHDGYTDIIFGFYSGGSWDSGERGYLIFHGSFHGLTDAHVFYQTNTNYALDYYDFGDFNADDKLDMFCIPSKKNLVQPSVNDGIINETDYVRVTTSNNKNLTNFYASKPSDFKVIDLDKDGKSDWLYYSSKDNDWRLIKTNGTGLYDGNTTELPFSGENCHFVDINGDGLIDVVKYANHERFLHSSSHPGGREGSIDYDIYIYDYTNWFIYLNKGNGSFNEPINIKSYNEILSNKLITLSDINNDGINDLIIVQEGVIYALTMPHANQQNVVTSVTNGMGLTESVSYKNLSEYESYNDNEIYSKIRPLRAPLLVVDTYTSVDGSKTVYSFEKPKFHTEGKGFLGFAVIKTSNADNNVKTISNYEFNQTYYFPALTSQSTSTIAGDNDISYSSQTNSVKVISSGLKRYIPYVSIQNNTDALKNLTQTTSTNYANYPNSLTQTTVTGDLTTSTITTFTGPQNKTPYLPSTVITTRTQNGESFTKQTNYSFIFDGTNSYKIIEKTETVDPDDVNSVATTYSNFDMWGHPQNISISANGKTRSSTIKYYKNSTTEPNAGQYLRTTTTTLGETTTYNWNETSGLLDSETDPRGNTTSYQYTSFGQLKQTVYPDGTRKAQVIRWDSHRGQIGTLSDHYTYSETSGSTPVWIYYDQLGRKIGQKILGLNGTSIYTFTKYDTYNRIWKVSEPTFSNNINSVTQWATEYHYDDYNRVDIITTPMGETNTVYNGLTTTVKTPESTTITTLNSAGQLITSNVNGKTVTYEYYPSGLVKSSTPQDGSPVTMAYNKQGKQTRVEDPNSGLTRSEYNGFGELTLSVQRVHISGDSIRTLNTYKTDGRLESINRNGEITTYTYNPTQNYQNRINTIELKDKNNQVQNRQIFTYDPNKIFDRVIQTKEEIVDNSGNLKEFISKTEYDALGRVKKEIFPSGYYTVNTFDGYGNLIERKDGSNRSIWKAVDENAKGQLLHVIKGIKTTTYDYYANGQTKEIKADGVVDMYYEYEALTHNLHSREDLLSNQKETFGYDGLDRLTNWTVNRNGIDTPYSMTYNPVNGTISNKSDLGNFTMKYGENGKPHALTSITGVPSIFPQPTAAYPTAELDVSYTDFKKIKTLSENGKSYTLTYGVDDERRKSVYTPLSGSGGIVTRYYLGDYEEEIDALGNLRQIHYLSGAIMIRTNGVETLYYTYADYQGSLIALTDASGNVVEKYAYNPWGVRRNPNDWTQKDNCTSWIVNRGYTGHEHLDAFGIINMNGRVYDPLTAQFFSPDPTMTDAGNWLDYNRYGYCLNNPFRYTDPSGYTWWAENGNAVLTTAASIVVGGVVTILTAGSGVPAMIASGMAAGAAGGFTSGAVGTALAGGSFNDAMSAGMQGAFMGVFTGALGGAAGGLAATAVGNAIGSSFGGFYAGALQGAAGGIAGGFAGGSIGAWMNGASFGDGLLAGLKGAGIGGLAGGLIGGTIKGIDAVKNGNANFWNGQITIDLTNGAGATGIADLQMKILKATYVGKFEDANVYESKNSHIVTIKNGVLKASGGMTLPEYGIIVGKGVLRDYKNTRNVTWHKLFQHEFGHILDYRSMLSDLNGDVSAALDRYYSEVGRPSFISATLHPKTHNLQSFEVHANILARNYFGNSYVYSSEYPLTYLTPQINILSLPNIERAINNLYDIRNFIPF